MSEQQPRSNNTSVQAEEAALVYRGQDHALLNAIPGMLFRFSTDGVFLEYFGGESSRLAPPPKAFLGKHAGDILPPGLGHQLMEGIRKVATTGQPVVTE